ncbi:MAG: hypothetical protein QNJ73_13075, partial [Gammaproteobacteria bacterium]|nr:hypothetical protein [Gammaproteobacteria bacterium]
KGVNWGYTPRNENFNYNLWSESPDRIRKVLDYEMEFLKKANVNAIRSFSMIPPEWITYIYREHGIMTAVNPLMGRYGYMVGGRWVEFTDYSDPLTRETLKRDMLEIIELYKNTPGVLMFAFGNESNYGLSWSSFEIENLPVGEQNTAKARFLYSLFNEVIKAGKEIAPNHPFTLVNGDIQYIDLIAELVPDLDILGSNVYRGPSFTDLWARVDEKLDLPVLFFEFGSDAYNARTKQEDEVSQAMILKAQWQEMYNKAWGNGEEGNSIGGFVFEWRDEWWKYLQDENLDIHDNNASWSNQAYLFDWREGKNNMNEEWFGIAALGKVNADGVYEARPRMAYDVLAETWSMDPYMYKKVAINQGFNDMDMELIALKSDVRVLKAESKERRQTVSFNGGSLKGEFVVKGTQKDIDEFGEEGLEFSDGQMLFLDFGFAPTERIEGRSTVNILGNVADTEPLIIQYGRRGLPVEVVIEDDPLICDPESTCPRIQRTTVLNDRERVEIYDFEASYDGDAFDVNAFYHVPRYHLKYEGDFFGLIRETTDLTSPDTGQDIWNAKAPSGIEFIGDEMLNGLTVMVGPELYWGANPKAVVKGDFSFAGVDYTFMHAEDLARRDEGVAATAATEIQTRQTTLYADINFRNNTRLEVGGIMASTEKVGDPYSRLEGSGVVFDEIDWEDTLGIKAKLSFDVGDAARSYVAGHYAGLVADGGDPLKEFGTRLPLSALGNKGVFEAGAMINRGNFMLFPRFMYRENLVDANPNIDPFIDPNTGTLFPGLNARNRDDDAFAVLDNREATAYELFLTYDPTGATPFYQWDNDVRENAPFAMNIGLNYTEYPTFTDSYQFFFDREGVNAAFGRGLPPEDVWEVSSRMVFVPGFDSRLILNLVAGRGQSTGDPTGGSRDYYKMDAKFIRGRHVFSGYFKKDAWGPYDFYRQFNITFPEQFRFDYEILLDELFHEDWSTRIGIRTLFWTVDENSPDDFYLDGENDYLFLSSLYFTFMF